MSKVIDKSNVKIIKSDVLVIGGGLAGCFCAMAARESGASVAVVDKGVLERSGDAGYGLADFLAYFADETPMEEALAILRKWPWSIYDYPHALQYLQTMPTILHKLEALGVRFQKDEAGKFVSMSTSGIALPLLMIENGKDLKPKIAEGVRASRARIHNRIMITNLLESGGEVTGAVGFNIRTGKQFVFNAKVTVLATGDSSRLFANNAFKNPFLGHMGPFNTGSAVGLAFDMGAECTDLELGYANLEPRGSNASGMAPLTGLGAHLLNSDGERYMLKYAAAGEKTDRPTLIESTLKEVYEGRGPIYIDCRHLSEDAWKHWDEVMPTLKQNYHLYLSEKGIDLRKDLMEMDVSGLEAFRGMVVTEKGVTNVPRLSAAGACTMFWLGMPGALTAGWSAGTEAAQFASKASHPDINESSAAELLNDMIAPLANDGGLNTREIEQALQAIMDAHVGFKRNEVGLQLAIRKIDGFGRKLEQVTTADLHELMRYHELKQLVTTAKVMARGALERKETRAWHSRSDYPQRNDPAWDGHVVLKKGPKDIEVEFRTRDWKG